MKRLIKITQWDTLLTEVRRKIMAKILTTRCRFKHVILILRRQSLGFQITPRNNLEERWQKKIIFIQLIITYTKLRNSRKRRMVLPDICLLSHS